MEIINTRSAETFKNPHNVKAAMLYDSEHAQAIHITLEPGESLKKHITPVDVFFYVLEGTGVVEIGEERHLFLSPDDFEYLFVKYKGVMHRGFFIQKKGQDAFTV